MSSTIRTFNCPAGANYDAFAGYLVYSSAANEVTIITDGDGAGQKPVGIIVRTDSTENGSAVSVCTAGECHIKLSANHNFTLGTEHFGPSNAGLGHQLAAGYWVVGKLDGNTAPAASELYPCIVQIENAVVAA